MTNEQNDYIIIEQNDYIMTNEQNDYITIFQLHSWLLIANPLPKETYPKA